MKIVEVIVDPIALDVNNEYERIRWRCANCNHGNINELSKSKIENWEEKGKDQYLSWDCKWCRRTNHLTLSFEDRECGLNEVETSLSLEGGRSG